MQNANSANASNSAEIVASLDDIMTQILVKVPIKPLFRSKLVSKHWLALISSHQFCLRRNPTPNPAQGVFLIDNSYHVYEYEYISLFPNNAGSFVPSANLNFTNAPYGTVILHSCNGFLLCCNAKTWIGDGNVLDMPMYVYNPTTMFSTALPDLPDLPSFTTRYPKCAMLAFDPIKSPHYKVVLVVVLNSMIGNTCEIEIYSSETRGWSYGCEIGMDRYDDIVHASGVYWNGSIHWLNQAFSARNPKNSIRFHVDNRMLGEMPSPPVVRDRDIISNIYFGESCDHLHFVECILPRFNVYEMKRDYSEWFVKYKVDLSPFIVAYPEVIMKGFHNQDLDVIYVLSLIRGKNDNESKLVLRIPEKALKFNLVDGTWEKLCDIAHDGLCHEAFVDENGYKEHFSYGYEYGLDYIQSCCNCLGL